MPTILQNLEAYFTYLEQDQTCNEQAKTHVQCQIQRLRRTSWTRSSCTESGEMDESEGTGSKCG